MFDFKNIVPGVFDYKGFNINEQTLHQVDIINKYEFNIEANIQLDDWERIVVVTKTKKLLKNLFLFQGKYIFTFSDWIGNNDVIMKEAFQDYWIDLDVPFWESHGIKKEEFDFGYIDNKVDSSIWENIFGKKLTREEILPDIKNSITKNHNPDFTFK